MNTGAISSPHHLARWAPLGVLLFALAFLPACASSGDGERVPRGSADHIIEAEVEAANVTNAYELVERLRPNWLRGRGAASAMNPGSEIPIVYIDNTRLGDLQNLRGIEIRSVREMRYIRAADATTRWGTGHAGGVIQVTMRSGY